MGVRIKQAWLVAGWKPIERSSTDLAMIEGQTLLDIGRVDVTNQSPEEDLAFFKKYTSAEESDLIALGTGPLYLTLPDKRMAIHIAVRPDRGSQLYLHPNLTDEVLNSLLIHELDERIQIYSTVQQRLFTNSTVRAMLGRPIERVELVDYSSPFDRTAEGPLVIGMKMLIDEDEFYIGQAIIQSRKDKNQQHGGLVIVRPSEILEYC